MSDTKNSECTTSCSSSAESLNRDCFCITLNPQKLHDILLLDSFNQDLLASHPQLFSSTSVFISPSQLQKISSTINAISRVASLSGYAALALAQSPPIAAHNPGASGVFMGYDFHLGTQGPQLIEINTNAGGAFLNAALLKAQSQCCRAENSSVPLIKTHIEDNFMAMFLREWALQRGDKVLLTIAIVDENPQQQFLYSEFKMAQHLFQLQGFKVVIVDPKELKFTDNKLCYNDQIIDLVYNRLTDFSFVKPELDALRQAYEMDAVVVTPNPRHHALYADKRNLAILSDPYLLGSLGANPDDIVILQSRIPATQTVSDDKAELLWQTRREYFFKPATGFGSRAAYRGDKLTKRVWAEILQGNYVAQKVVPPSERGILLDGQEAALKIDIRAYVYASEIQLLAARLYQGQTTNFRTRGGGFAPVFIAEGLSSEIIDT